MVSVSITNASDNLKVPTSRGAVVEPQDDRVLTSRDVRTAVRARECDGDVVRGDRHDRTRDSKLRHIHRRWYPACLVGELRADDGRRDGLRRRNIVRVERGDGRRREDNRDFLSEAHVPGHFYGTTAVLP